MPMRLSCEDSKPLILLVKQRPLLYDPKNKDYNNREVKKEAWNEISQTLVGNDWNSLNDSERETMRQDVKVRWKSLKDAYIRSLRIRKQMDSSRPYVYENQIKFLKAIHFGGKGNTETEQEVEEEDFNEYGEELGAQFEDNAYSFLQVGQQDESFHEDDTAEGSSRRSGQLHQEVEEDDGQNCNKRKRMKVEDPAWNFLQEGTSGVELESNNGPSHIDEDKFFLLSLVPQLKEMSTVEKLDFKIGVMQLLKTNVINRKRNVNNCSLRC